MKDILSGILFWVIIIGIILLAVHFDISIGRNDPVDNVDLYFEALGDKPRW